MRFFIFLYLLLVTKIIHANEDLGKVVASPNKSLLQLEKTGSSILLIEKSDIGNSSSTSTSGLLQEFGGFSVAPKGNKGSDPS